MSILKKIKRSLSNFLTYFKRPKPVTKIVLTYDVEQLIEQLERRYPVVQPSPSDTMSEIQFRAGQRSVVTNLKQLHLRQQQKKLE